MNGKKQTTLFQSWGGKSTVSQKSQGNTSSRNKATTNPSTSKVQKEARNVIDLCDSFDDEDDDDILCQAEESIFDLHKSTDSDTNIPLDKDDDHVCDISIGVDGSKLSQVSQPRDAKHMLPGFDYNAGKIWIYPTNYPVRDYQFNIVQQALYKNTMVTLPTGLGKTFIAAVVMYNFYRWYPLGKVVFMAPTKPLVAQQIEACYNIMGIPQEHTAEMTGTMGPQKRETAWHDKRVFFLTPQVLTNDLSRGSCPGSEVKCLVIDEAHKALGNHAYCQVVRELIKYTENFRVLALSATPGSDIKSVQLVLSNLLISHIELRTEESIDIKRYSHERKVEKVVVPLGEELTKVKTKYIQIMDMVVQKLKRLDVIYHRETTSLSKFLILKAREAFRQNPPENLQRSQYGIVEGDFAMAMSLYHGYELLQLHGSRSLYNFLQSILTGDKSHGRTRTELTKNADFNDLIELLSEKYKQSEDGSKKPMVVGHPKMLKLQEIILHHFQQSKDQTRVMIFSQYRDSVQEITDMLHVHEPMIKVMSFIGQASAGKARKGFTQKEQLMVMKQFREGGYNTLVSTCVGEEGLDIGDVDLIICFDAHKSPIRLVQRMGRTGRKREGKIVMLVTEGKEEQIYNQSQYSKRSIHKAILNGARSLHFYQNSPRMVPEDLNPTIHKMHITVKESFKTDKKIATGKNSEQKKITQALSDAGGSKSGADDIISLAEYRELEPWLVPEAEVPKLPVKDLISVPPKTAQESPAATGAVLSLSEWTPWQTTLQSTGTLDHTMESRHLVELMEFVQIQQSLDPEDDPYGLEMAAYLNEEDILKPDEDEHSKGTLLKFYKPTVSNKTGSSHTEVSGIKKGKAKTKSKVRRSDKLAQFEAPDCAIVTHSSDEDLPAFDVDGKSNKRLSEDSNNGDTSKGSCRLDKNIDNDQNRGIDKGVNGENNVIKAGENKSSKIESQTLAMEKRMNEKKNRKRKRKPTGNQSVISVIADTDNYDFDQPEVKLDNESEDDLPALEMTTNKAPSSSTSISHYQHKVVDTKASGHLMKEKISTKDLKGRQYFIGTPPPLKELDDLFSAIDDKASLDIDLCELVKEWHMDNKIHNYIYLPPEKQDVTPYDSSDDELMVPVLDKSNHSETKCKIKTPEVLQKPEKKVNVGIDNKDIVVKNDTDEKSQSSVLGNIKFDAENDFSDEHSSSSLSDELPQFNVFHDDEKLSEFEASSSHDHKTIKDTEKSVQLEESPVFKKSQSRKISVNETSKIAKPSALPFSPHNNKGPLHSSESCFSDSMDDSLFKAVKTPHFPGIHNSGTQVTFTQAFACIQSTSSSVGSSVSQDDLRNHHKHSDTTSTTELHNQNSDTQLNDSDIELHAESSIYVGNNIGSKDILKDNMPLNDSNEVFSDEHNDHSLVSNVNKKLENISHIENFQKASTSMEHRFENKNGITRKASISSSDGDEEFPDFDLGFNVDEDIIPPSPNANLSQTSNVSRLSQNFRTTFMEKSQRNTTVTTQTSRTNIEECPEENTCKPGRRKQLFKNTLKPCIESAENVEVETKDNTSNSARKSSGSVASCNSERSELKSPIDNCDNDFDENHLPQDDSKGREINLVQSVTDEGTEGEQADFSCSPMLETSFALLDEDLDDWITAGTDIPHKESTTSHNVPNETGNTTGHTDGGNTDCESFDNYPQDRTCSPLKRASVCGKVMPSEWFDDSFTSPANSSKVETPKADLGGWLSKRSSTSTPLLNSSTPHVKSSTPFDRSNKLAVKPFTPLGRPTTVTVNSSTPHLNKSRKIQTVTPFRNDNTASKLNASSDGDDSFVVRRKKKVTILDSPGSDVEECMMVKKKTNDSGDTVLGKKQRKSTFMLSSSSESANDVDDFDDSFLNTRNNYIPKKPEKSIIINDISDDDFEESFVDEGSRQNKNNESNYDKVRTKIGKVKQSKSSRHLTEMKPKRPSNPFIDEEAELSDEDCGDASSDEDEGSEQDEYDASFIQDSQCSQQSQALDQTDMQALYMKSVKSPIGNCRGYKLKFDSKHVDVYSQVPRDEESQYMEDSFCVGSEEEADDYDWLAMGAEESHGEITIMHQNATILNDKRSCRRGQKTFQTSRQRAIHADRMNALNKIKAKKAGKIPRGGDSHMPVIPENISKPTGLKKNRIQVLVESSSEEEEAGVGLDQSSLFSPAPKPSNADNKKRPRILSSSDDEKDEIKVKNRISSREDSDDFDDTTHLSIRKNNSCPRTSKRQKIYDDEFEEQFHICPEGVQNAEKEDMTKIKPNRSSFTKSNDKINKQSLEINTSQTCSTGMVLPTSISASKHGKKAVIIVDYKELSGAQDVISDLRFKHNIHVTAASLSGCDYIVSNRMAVDRKQWSEFSNGSNRNKLIERMTQLSHLYDRACLIVEKERLKPGEEKSKPIHWTKFLDKTCAMLLRSNIRVLFSDSQHDTAGLLSDLCLLEQRKDMAITARTELSPSKANMVKFFSTFPNITYVNALNMCERYSSIQEFLSSTISVIEGAGKMSKTKATALYNYIRRDFDPQMLPVGSKF